MSSGQPSFEQEFGQSLSIRPGGAAGICAVYGHGSGHPKPCLHPLTTAGGVRLTGFEMSDHVWHRGLWFTIKFVNGSNFWEENAPYGVQVSRAEPACTFAEDGAVRVTHDVDWTSEATGTVIRETRTLTFRVSGATQLLDWETELHAAKDLTLDRTPYTTWGGYGGLSFRGSRELHDAVFDLPTGESVTSLAGQPHPWIVMRAKADGGAGKVISMGVVDHPSNLRAPTPWYCKSGNGFTYWNAAFLFHEPLAVKAGAALKLKYRVAFRDGLFGTGEFPALAQAFRSEAAK